jgi:hypothetical protein
MIYNDLQQFTINCRTIDNHLQSMTGWYTMIYNDLKPFTINYRTINNHLK